MSDKLFTGEYKPPPAQEAGKFIFRRNDPTTGLPRSPMVFGIDELEAFVTEAVRMLEEYQNRKD